MPSRKTKVMTPILPAIIEAQLKRFWYMSQERLSITTAQMLAALPFRSDAKRRVCILPLGSICWEDEMPDLAQLMTMPENTEASVAKELEAFFADADQVTISEKDGVQSFSATFDLTKKPTGDG